MTHLHHTHIDTTATKATSGRSCRVLLSMLSLALLGISSSLISTPAQADNLIIMGNIPRAMAISQRTNSLISMNTFQSVVFYNPTLGMDAGAKVDFLFGQGQWNNKQFSAYWTWREPNYTQHVRASMTFSDFSGEYAVKTDNRLSKDQLSHMQSYALNYAIRQSLPFVYPGFSLMYGASLQYNKLDLAMPLDKHQTTVQRMAGSLTRMGLSIMWKQSIPLRSYAHASAFGGYRLAYRRLKSDKVTNFCNFRCSLQVPTQNFVDNQLMAALEIDYHDANLFPSFYLSARYSVSIRLNKPSMKDTVIKDSYGYDSPFSARYIFNATNLLDQQWSLKAHYTFTPNLSAGVDWTVFYQSAAGMTLGGNVSYTF